MLKENLYETYTINTDDTIQLIASKFGVKYEDIVALNNLVYPYIIDSTVYTEPLDATGFVAKVGDTIFIPITKEANNYTSGKKLEYTIYGKDIEFMRHPNDILEPYNLRESNGDLSCLEGVGNLYQACLSRLTVQKGGLVLHPEYGTNIYRYLGKGGTKANLVKISLEVRRTLLQDIRIQDVKDIKVDFENNGVIISAKIVPIKPMQPFELTHRI